MKKFISFNKFINANGNKLALVLAIIVGVLRYSVCKEITCSVSYALTTLIILQFVLFVYKLIAKQIITKAISKNPSAFVNNVVFNGGNVANSTENKTETETVEVQAVNVEKGDKNEL